MCRLSAYKGKSILLGDLIVKPKNSLVCQSRDAWFHPGVVDREHVRNIRVNGDGFGAAFYGTSPEAGSCIFKFVTPAWSNKNLINIGNYVHSNLIMAHVRAASNGKDPFEEVAVSIENCHPFKYGRWTFMHNGGVPHFHKVKRALLNALSEECFEGLTGSTDSEHIFALFLNYLPDRNASSTVEETTIAIEKTISKVLALCRECNVTDPCSLNFVFSDGRHIFATRFRNSHDSPPSLYYNYGKDFNSETGSFEIHDKALACEIVVSSAPLSKRCLADEKCGNWTLLPDNTMLVCIGDDHDLSRVNKIYVKPIDGQFVGQGPNPCLQRVPSALSMVFDHSSLPTSPSDDATLGHAQVAMLLACRKTDSSATCSYSLQQPNLMRSSINEVTTASTTRFTAHLSGEKQRHGVPVVGPLSPVVWSDDMYTTAPYTGQLLVPKESRLRCHSLSGKSTVSDSEEYAGDQCTDTDEAVAHPKLHPSASLPVFIEDPVLPATTQVTSICASTPPRAKPEPLTSVLMLHCKPDSQCVSPIRTVEIVADIDQCHPTRTVDLSPAAPLQSAKACPLTLGTSRSKDIDHMSYTKKSFSDAPLWLVIYSMVVTTIMAMLLAKHHFENGFLCNYM